MKTSVIISFIAFIVLISEGYACAGDYYVNWWQMHKRTYENGNTFNRVAFGVTDASGAYIPTNIVKSISLEGPGGKIAVSPITFLTYEVLSSYFDPNTGRWHYDTEFHFENYYGVNFSEDLIPGNYSLQVVDIDNETILSDTRYFNGVVEPPPINSKSFRGYEDTAGNLIWRWSHVLDTDFWTTADSCSIKCWFSIYNENSHVGDIYVHLPVIAQIVFIPSWVMEKVKRKGDNFTIGLHVRCGNDSARYYTSALPLTSLRKMHPKVVVVPLN